MANVKEMMRLTVLIVTYERKEWLARAIRSVFYATSSLKADAVNAGSLRIAIRVFVNGRDEETLEQLTALRKEAGGVAFEVAEGRKVNPGEARNIALRDLDSDWVFFLDDDAFLPPDFFTELSAVLAKWPEASAIGGPNLTPNESLRFQSAAGLALESRFATLLSSRRYRRKGPAKFCTERDLILCNLLVKRSALERDPFPVDFVCAEENWLLQTLESRGARLVYSPELYVFHERRETVASFARQVYKYGFGRGQNIRRRPATLLMAHILPLVSLLFFVASFAAAAGGVVPHSVWFGLAAVYAMLCLAASASVFRRGGRDFFLVAAIFPVIHFFYALGVGAALLGFHP